MAKRTRLDTYLPTLADVRALRGRLRHLRVVLEQPLQHRLGLALGGRDEEAWLVLNDLLDRPELAEEPEVYGPDVEDLDRLVAAELPSRQPQTLDQVDGAAAEDVLHEFADILRLLGNPESLEYRLHLTLRDRDAEHDRAIVGDDPHDLQMRDSLPRVEITDNSTIEWDQNF